MNSSNTNKISVESDKEIVYKYQMEVFIKEYDFSYRNTEKILEFFIPSYKICFNQQHIFHSNSPRNMINKMTFHAWEPLTAIEISKCLIDEIKQLLPLNLPSAKIKEYFAENDEYQTLFFNKPCKSILVNNILMKVEDSFWEKLEKKGNNVIKKTLVKYIKTGIMPEEMTLSHISQILTRLDQIEIQSIIDCIRSELAIKDGKLNTLRLKEIKEVENQDDSFTDACLGSVGGALLATKFSVDFMTGMGLGFFGGYGMSYATTQYQKHLINKHWARCEERASEILSMLETNQAYKLTPNK